ncbi:hypothetical protein [Aureimonas pseudogalii]|uniref:Uncharacterized protein n=1 Tax=Aureimonas pseudogalii TaxID=1744844 RepID=A0A7W6MMH1_9HYPH|nr:hypothetical protein [Aureimonas pseudogalii]MBB4000843.1 hypothetical protein [Aureimonas pseudogalii]
MRSPFNPISSSVFEAVRLAREAIEPLNGFHDRMSFLERTSFRSALDQLRPDASWQRALQHEFDVERIAGVSDLLRAQTESDLRWREMLSPLVIEQAQLAAEFSRHLSLPSAMEQFRTPVPDLRDKLLNLHRLELWTQPAYMDAFNRTSALSDVMADSLRVGRELRDAARAFSLEAIPSFDSLIDYRHFLDAAGLQLSRWPRLRLLSAAEKRRRFKARLKEKIEPAHVKRAKTMVHRYELTLREILDQVMADAYGEEWPETRLPLCGCNDLLGKWRGAHPVLTGQVA